MFKIFIGYFDYDFSFKLIGIILKYYIQLEIWDIFFNFILISILEIGEIEI